MQRMHIDVSVPVAEKQSGVAEDRTSTKDIWLEQLASNSRI